jgi:hypothetical protein
METKQKHHSMDTTDEDDEEKKVLDYVVKRLLLFAGSLGTLERQCVRGSV